MEFWRVRFGGRERKEERTREEKRNSKRESEQRGGERERAKNCIFLLLESRFSIQLFLFMQHLLAEKIFSALFHRPLSPLLLSVL